MTLALLLRARSYLKFLGPVLTAALARGHRVVAVIPPGKAKPGDALERDELLARWPVIITDEIPSTAEVVIGLNQCLDRYETSVRKILVDPFYDAWLRPPWPPRALTSQCYASAYHRAKHGALWRPGSWEIGGPEVTADHHPIVGWPPSDWAHTDYQPLPTRDLAVFFSLKLGVPEPWRRSRPGQAEYRRLAERARDLATEHGLRFVVKGRAKNEDPRWLRRLGEYVTDAGDLYASLSLLRRARWAVHFESAAAFEIGLMGVYGCAIAVPQPHIVGLPGGALKFGHAAWNDWPGVAQYGLPGTPPAVDAVARARWVETFLGPCDGKVGQRIVEIAEGT